MSNDDVPGRSNGGARLKSVTAWWMLTFSIVTGVAGVLILVGLAVVYATTHKTSVVLVIAGVGLCGPVIAASAGAFAQAIRGGGKP